MTWFSRLRNWQQDQANGIGIRSDYHDQEDDNFATGINASINVAGGNTPTSNLPMGNFRHTGAGNGVASSDYATMGQAQTNVASYAVDASGTDAYAITPSPAIAGYAAGQSFSFYAATSNTGAATLAVSGLTAKAIKKDGGAALVDSDIVAGQVVRVIYDGTNFQMQSPVYGNVGQNGGSVYAADAGSTDAYAITLSPAPVAYVTGMKIKFKANTVNTGAATLNVNGLGAKTIKRGANADLSSGDIEANQIVEVIYDGTNFQMTSAPYGAIGQNGASVYAADAGASDAYAITLSPAPTAYWTGMKIKFKANTLNTGAATLNVNSLGAKTIKKFGTTNDIATGDILANQIVEVIYDGTNFQMTSALDDINNLTTDGSPDPTADYCKTWDASASTYKKVLLNNFGALAASQADQETGTSTTTYVSPGRQQYHTSATKVWARFNDSGLTASYNVSSVSNTATGTNTVNFTTAFSGTAAYSVSGCVMDAGGTNGIIGNDIAFSASSIKIMTIKRSDGTTYNATNTMISLFGDQ